MRAGIFGGTFNPIHNGHLMVAQEALDRLDLDRLYVVPCWAPPHKHPAYLAPADQRVQMIRLALPADERYRLCEVEIRRRGPSFTIDTVNDFRTRIVPGARLFLIMGTDAFLDIHTWKRYRRLLEVVEPVVVSRSVDDNGPIVEEIDRLDGYLCSHLSADYRFDRRRCHWQRKEGRIHLLATPPLSVSSSQVRQRIREGNPVADLVPPAVNAYIDQKDLYR